MSKTPNHPEVGQLVYVRNRPASVKSIKSKTIGISKTENKELHLVEVEYIDDWDFPKEDMLIWERERNAKIISSFELPPVQTSTPTNVEYFNSYVNAIRWSALGQYLNLDD